MSPISPIHDVNINISNSCNDCFENTCMSCCREKAPTPPSIDKSIQTVSQDILNDNEEKKEEPVIQHKIIVKKKSCVIL